MKQQSTPLFLKISNPNYTLEEIKTPEGHVGLKEPVQIVIQEDGEVTIAGEPTEVHLHKVGKQKQPLQLVVTNQALSLPETGGMEDLASLLVSAALFHLPSIRFCEEKGNQ